VAVLTAVRGVLYHPPHQSSLMTASPLGEASYKGGLHYNE